MLEVDTKPAAAAPDLEFERFARDWRQIGLTTEPAARKEAEAAIKKVYATAGLDAPRKIVWCGSPYSQGLARAIVLAPEFATHVVKSFWKHALNPSGTDFKDNVEESFRNSMRVFDTSAVKQPIYDGIKADVRKAMTEKISEGIAGHARCDAVWDSVWASVWDSLSDTLWKAIDSGMRTAIENREKEPLKEAVTEAMKDFAGENVKARAWDGLMDQAWSNVRNAIASKIRVRAWEELWKSLQTVVWEQVATRIGEQVKACGNNTAQASGYGQHDAYWLAFYTYFREAHALGAETEPVAALLELARCAGWFTPHAKVCWVSERPCTLALDRAGRLHAAGAPALEYPDGWTLYANEGTLVGRPANAAAAQAVTDNN